MSQALEVKNQPLAQIRAALSEESLAQLEAALPPDVSPSRFLQVANTAVLRDPNLAKPALRQSLFLAAMKCATAGLLPDGEQAALAAFGSDVTFMPMIAGYRYIAGLHGWDLRGYVVYENDDFDYALGDKPWVKHKPPRLGDERGKERGAYATATHRDGTVKIEVMDAAQVAAIEAKASNKALWKGSSRARMIEKTPAKALFKRLPLGEKESERIRRLIDENGVILDPVAALYGGNKPPALEAPAPAGDGGPQAAAPLSPGGAAAPGDDEFDWSAAPTPAGPQPLAAGDTVLPEAIPTFGGQKISDVAETDLGRGYLLWALSTAPEADPTRLAIETFVRAELPDVWAEHQAAGSGS